MNNYIRTGWRRTWIMFDLDNGHVWNSRDSGEGYIWVFPTRQRALNHRQEQHKKFTNAKLSYPKKITFGKRQILW